jgi:hypothetical protein
VIVPSLGTVWGTITEKKIVALVSPTLGFVESWLMVIEVVEPAPTPDILTCEAVPFVVDPESATVSVAPPVKGQLLREEVG